MEKWPVFKNENQLENQVSRVSKKIGAEITPKKIEEGISLDQIKERYPERYGIYLKMLRAERNKTDIDDAVLREMGSIIQALNNLDKYIESHEKNHCDRILRQKQFDVFMDIREFLEQGGKEGYIKLPTGVGKTVLFSQIVEAMGLKTLIVVPSKILVDQTGEKLEIFTDLEFGKYYEDEKDLSKNVVTITYQSLISAVENGIIKKEDYDLIVLDEAHKALGEKTANIIEGFGGIKIGFTATPKYSRGKHLGELLEHEIHSMSIVEGVQDGLINRFKSFIAYTETDLSEVKIDNNGEYDKEQIERALNNKARNLSAVELYQKAFYGESAIANCSGIKHAEDLAALFNENGIKAVAISGKIKKKKRKEILESYERGEIMVLCNARLLLEGFDEPRASVALNLHPSFSRVDVEQRAGRVLRTDQNNKQKWSKIVDFIDANSPLDPILFAEVAGASEVTRHYLIDDAQKESKNEVSDNEVEREKELGYPGLENIKIENLRIIVDAREVMSVTSDNAGRRSEIVPSDFPEGWMTPGALHKVLKLSFNRIKEFAEKIRPDHPEWFRIGTSGVHTTTGYHPDLVDLIKKELVIPKLKEGWRTAKSLIGEHGGSVETVKKFIESYRESNPEWFGKFKVGSGEAEAYHPELVSIITEKVLITRNVEGWKSALEIEREGVSINHNTIKNFVERFRDEHKEWFGKKRSGPGIVDIYHPDLVALIEKELILPKIDENWEMSVNIWRRTGISDSKIKKFVERFRASNPEWFKMFKSGSHIAEGYHPDLVAIIEKELFVGKLEDGWETAVTLSKKGVASTATIRKFASSHKAGHPEWFKLFKSGPHEVEGYHPDLISLIVRKYDNRRSGGK